MMHQEKAFSSIARWMNKKKMQYFPPLMKSEIEYQVSLLIKFLLNNIYIHGVDVIKPSFCT